MNINTMYDDKLARQTVYKPVIDWSDQLATGLDDVDAQHQKLIDIVNRLSTLQACDTPSDELFAVYDELKNYTLYHFKYEEEQLNAWPVDATNKAAHLKAHQGFIDRIAQIDALIVSHPSYVVDHLLAFLVKWLVHHISDVDMRMAREIIALRTGKPVDAAAIHEDLLSNSLSELYDGIGIHSLEIVDLNIQLQAELKRRVKAEDEAQLATLVFENSSEAMSVTDAEDKIIAINPAFTRLTGYLPEDIIGQNPNILSSGRHDKYFYQVMWDSIVATGHWDGELWNQHKNGRIFAERLSINTIYKTDGTVDRRVAVFSDITDKKLTQEKLASQALELKELVEKEAALNARLSTEIAVKNRLFSIISHDLRSPFTLLTGMTQSMILKADKYSKKELVDRVGVVNRVSKSVYSALENLLEWSRAQLEGEKLDIGQVAVRDVVLEALDTLGLVAAEKGVEIVSDVTETVVCTDHHVMLTIVRNLISNAIKFSEPGGVVKIAVQSQGVQSNGEWVEISVTDTGVGISETMIDNIFNFDQKTTTLGTSGEKGTGLGLPLCADLATKLGGTLRVESKPGEGARFIVMLPASCPQST